MDFKCLVRKGFPPTFCCFSVSPIHVSNTYSVILACYTVSCMTTGTVGSDRGGKVTCMETLFSKYIVDWNIHPCQIKTFTVYNEEYIHFALFSAKRLETLGGAGALASLYGLLSIGGFCLNILDVVAILLAGVIVNSKFTPYALLWNCAFLALFM